MDYWIVCKSRVTLLYKKLPNSFPKQLYHFTLVPAKCEFQLPHIVSITWYGKVIFFIVAILISAYQPLCDYRLHSLMIIFLEYLFLCLHPSKYLLWCSVCSDLLLLILGFSFIVWLLENFMHSSYKLCQKSDFKIVSLAVWLISSFSEFFHRTQAFNFDEV